MREAAQILASGFVLLVFGGVAAPPAPAPPQADRTYAETEDDLRFVVSEAQKVQGTDVAAWAAYRFGRRSEREDFDDGGRIVEREEMQFLVTPEREGFREELVSYNGQVPDPAEVERHRRAGSFGRHYRTLVAGAGGEAEEGGYSLGQLLYLASYKFAGREPLNGVECYRLDFGPDDVRPKVGGLAAKFTKAMAGSLWITVEGFHLAGARAETVRPISIALSLSKIYSLKIRMDAGPVGTGVWLPARVEVITNARILIRSIRRRNFFTYSDYERLGGAPG
jgi:hypothetical protein